jgi:hypothetical protein
VHPAEVTPNPVLDGHDGDWTPPGIFLHARKMIKKRLGVLRRKMKSGTRATVGKLLKRLFIPNKPIFRIGIKTISILKKPS